MKKKQDKAAAFKQAKDSFKEYLELRLSEKNEFQKKLLLTIRDQLKDGNALIKSVSLSGVNQNGKTIMIKMLLEQSQLKPISIKSYELGDIHFNNYAEMLEYITKNDNYVAIISNKIVASDKSLIDTSFKQIIDIIDISKQKNAMVMFEGYDFPYQMYGKFIEDSFRLRHQIEHNIILETPPIAYRLKFFDEYGIIAPLEAKNYFLKYSIDLSLGQFHSCLKLLKSFKGEINKKAVQEIISSMKHDELFEKDVSFGINSIIGNDWLKEKLHKIRQGYEKINQMRGIGITRNQSYLFTGNPGTGKTFAVRCLSNELGLPLHHITLSALEEEDVKVATALKGLLAKAIRKQPCILFIDEAEKIFGKNSLLDSDGPLQGEFQQMIDGNTSFSKDFNGIIIMNSNEINKFSAPLLDRFEIIKFPNPSSEDRMAYLVKKNSMLPEEMQTIVLRNDILDRITGNTEGNSYRELERQWSDFIFSLIVEERHDEYLIETFAGKKAIQVSYMG